MKAKEAGKQVQNVLDELYIENFGSADGEIAKALNKMNNELGWTNPFCKIVRNRYDHVWEFIQPGEIGVLKQGGGGKRTQRVVPKKATTDKTDKEVSE